jgi:hypothetical protein
MIVVARNRAEFLRLQWHIAALRFEIKLIKHLLLLRKAGFDPDQSRDEQGRWVDTGAGNRPGVSEPLRITILSERKGLERALSC